MKTKINVLLIGSIIFITGCFPNRMDASETKDKLRFIPDEDVAIQTLTLPNGKSVNYRGYEDIFYVENIVDPTYQTLNIYIPESIDSANRKAPIFLKTNIGGYMAAKATAPSPTDATGRALLEGYIVVIPGARGSNSKVIINDMEISTGRAPAGLVDLKAAIRYLRYNDEMIPGNKELIITDGTSAGGAMSALLGATGNNPIYDPYLEEMGVPEERDDIFAAVCFCPITDLEHADMGYEWLYHGTNMSSRGLSAEQMAVSNELAGLFPVYLDSLGLLTEEGTPVNSTNYFDYVKSFLIQSAQRARDAGLDIPEETGVKLNAGRRGSGGEFVTDIDLGTYLNYVVSKQPLKTPPAFDQMDVLIDKPSPENSVFGDETGNGVNFTDFSLRKATNNPSATINAQLKERIYSMNPMNFIGDGISQTAPHWYIRHGALDRDTSFSIPINLYTKLINHGYNTNFALAWNRPHTGDYSLDELFSWLNGITKKGD